MPMNYSYDAGIKATLPEAYIMRKALKNVEPELVYLRDAQKVAMPKNNGKYVTFTRYSELPAADDPLIEGVTPDGQKLEMTSFSVRTKQYGRHMEYTDEIDLFHVDKKTDAMADRLIRQAKLTIDTVGRNAICAGLNVMYPGAVTSRAALDDEDILNYATIKLAVRNLRRKGAQPFADGYLHSVISHETYYDLTQDTHWNDVAKYQSDERVQKYEVGKIYDVKFFVNDNPKIFTNETYLYGAVSSLTAYADFDVANKEMIVTATMTADEARKLEGKLVYVQYKIDSTTYDTPMCVERIWPSATANQTRIRFRWVPGTSTTDNWTTAKTLKIVPSGGATSGDPVHATIIYGQDAFGMVNLGSAKAPNFRVIIKPLGSSGSSDPLDQRGSIAWKVPNFAVAVIQDDFIVRIEHGVTA
jgi:N4-gp56 family major capsid protein